MEVISSVSNSKIKDVSKLHQKKHRDESGLFIVEGLKALEELISSNIEIENIYAKNKIVENDKLVLCSEPVLKKLSSTDSIPTVITVAKQRLYNISDILNKNFLVVLDNIKDPGNLGTIIRSAAAFSVDAIILIGDSVDLYNSKVMRSSAGNFFRIPILYSDKLNIKAHFSGHKIIATGLYSKTNIDFMQMKNIKKKIIMFGSEASGLSESLLNEADYNLIIPTNEQVESLNVATAASIVFYENFKN